MTLAECCFDTGGAGAEVSIDALNVGRDSRLNDAVALFGESASRIVVSASRRQCDRDPASAPRWLVCSPE